MTLGCRSLVNSSRFARELMAQELIRIWPRPVQFAPEITRAALISRASRQQV